jgi:hypothetical protein
METYEMLTIFVSIVALFISALSLYRTRKNNEIHLELNKIHAKLAEKQISRMEESEVKEGQPNFAIWVTRKAGHGDSKTPDFRIRVTFSVENTGESYLEPQSLGLVCLRDGVFLSSVIVGASLEPIDIRDRDPILGDHILVLKPDSKLEECKLHIRYIDKNGDEKIQEFKVFPSGRAGIVPDNVIFEHSKTYKIKASGLWSYQY